MEVFRPIRQKNTLLLALCQVLNIFGDDFFNMACMWVVYADSQSVFLSSLVGVVWHLTDAIIAPIAGLVVDRYSKKRVIFASNACAMCYSLLLAIYVAWRGELPIWLAIFSMAALNIFTAFVSPARSAMVLTMIPKENLDQVNGFFAFVSQAAAVLSSSLSGLVLAALGLALSLSFNTLSYFLVIVGFYFFSWGAIERQEATQRQQQTKKRGQSIQAMREGLRYLLRHPILRNLSILAFLVNLTSFTGTLMPALIYENFGDKPFYFGLFQSAMTLGAVLAGAGIMTGKVKGSRLAICVLLLLSAGTTVMMAWSRLGWLMAMMMFASGVWKVMSGIFTETLTMRHLDVAYAGRVFGFMKTIAIICIPIATLLAGYLGESFSIQTVFTMAGLYFLVCAFLAWFLLDTKFFVEKSSDVS